MGIVSGIMATFMGLGDFGSLNTLISYSAIGIGGVDLALLLLGNPENLVVATLRGGSSVILPSSWSSGFGAISGAPLGFIALGLARSIISYLVFGALGGS